MIRCTRSLLRKPKFSKAVVTAAARMRASDFSGKVPVPSFAYDLLKQHPSLLERTVDDRMDFLLRKWKALPDKSREQYVKEPLRGLL